MILGARFFLIAIFELFLILGDFEDQDQNKDFSPSSFFIFRVLSNGICEAFFKIKIKESLFSISGDFFDFAVRFYQSSISPLKNSHHPTPMTLPLKNSHPL